MNNKQYFKETLKALNLTDVLSYELLGLSVGDETSTSEIASLLTQKGYIKVSRVTGEGEFSVSGDVIDINPFGLSSPFRINLDFDRVESIEKLNLSKRSESIIDTFTDLKKGDLVVHKKHGIARFISLERIIVQNTQRDYIKLEFKDKEFYYVPIEMADMVSRYIGDKDKCTLSSLSSKLWSKKCENAQKSAREFAKSLVVIYAKRRSIVSFSHQKDTAWQQEFESSFKYTLTNDQQIAINEIKADMEKPSPMDRLLCGDVGYGKTEIAFRACFKAVMSGKQVVFLSPTTILTAQHFNKWKERTEKYPIKSVELTRNVKPKVLKENILSLSKGDADIVFATHKVLQSGINFKNLGLLVIDEEQRFGVKDKEKIRAMKANVDTLCLSATPIPRTLYMSILKIRDVSLLKTPPKSRLPVETYIGEFDEEIVKRAILFEKSRGGRVFYIHNRIEDIIKVVNSISTLTDNVRVSYTHGKMRGDLIEDRISEFIKGDSDVLVSTTLIENGIDIPSANTIIIDDASYFGTSEMYQLRGRVGRGSTQGYAYIFYKKDVALTEEVASRLSIIEENTALGSGFKIALSDMEKRGAGNILGKEQSGFITDVGLDMYMHLLDKEIKKIENKSDVLDEEDVFIDIKSSVFIEDSFIDDTNEKFKIYKKVTSSSTLSELLSVRDEIISNYGEIPKSLYNLFYIVKSKLICKVLNINKIAEKDGIITVYFKRVSSIDVNKMLSVIRMYSGEIYLSNTDKNAFCIKLKEKNKENKELILSEILSYLK